MCFNYKLYLIHHTDISTELCETKQWNEIRQAGNARVTSDASCAPDAIEDGIHRGQQCN